MRVSTVLDAPPDRVWADLRDIASHVDWMDDAVAISFRGSQREGVGTEFDCRTRVGPLRLRDRMVVTEWVDGRVIGIRHDGLVHGRGRFTLSRKARGRTKFTWTERLRFPWWAGGRLTGLAATPVLRRVWKRNLRNLQARVSAR
jgi:hypothetical protein